MTFFQKICLGSALSCLVLLGGWGILSVRAATIENNMQQLPFKRLINMGNALEAPKGIPWDVTLEDRYFTTIHQAGFDGVRLPVRLSDYAKDQPGYKLDEAFMKKLDAHIQFAMKENLYVILDMHHFNELMADPNKYHEAFLAIWRQVAHRYRHYPSKLVFEVLNEPHQNITAEQWNTYLAEAVAIIREENPERWIIAGGIDYNSINGLDSLRLPDTAKMAVTFHYYEPQEFTFQEHPYLGYEKYKDVKWEGSQDERQYVADRFAKVAFWARNQGVPVLLGEFGVNELVPEKERYDWTNCVRVEAEKNNFSWAYWEYGSIFGAYDLKTNTWRDFLLKALFETT